MPKAEIKAKNSKEFNHAKTRWERNGYRVDFRAQDDEDCAAHSYGKVHDFFSSNSCELLSRAVFELRDKHQNLVLVAISRVNMPNTGDATELKMLVDTGGTGNVTELSRESGPYRAIRYTGEGYTSSLRGLTVQNTQVQPVAWAPAKIAIEEILKDAPVLS